MKVMNLTSVLFCISFTITTHSQIKSNSFVRVYDSLGNKIGKGKIRSHNSNTLFLKKGKDSIRIELEEMGSIKTKRSVGSNFAKGAVVGAGVGLIYAIANDAGDGFATEEGYYAGIPFTIAVGAGVGGITALFKDSNEFIINGDTQKWEQFRTLIESEE